MNYILEIESKNKSEAQKRAADLLGIPEDELDFETEGAGLLGMMARKPVVVRVRAKNDPGDQALITGVLLTLMHKMGIEADIEDFEDTEENYIIHVESEDSGILIGRQGKTLDALQFLLNLLVTPELTKKKRILVDVARYRERRKKKLNKLAKSVADRVAKSGRSVLLESMNPYERRIVHLTLEEDDRVTTRSEGNGLYKRVRVVVLRSEGDDVEEEYYEEEYYEDEGEE
ncbi:MAG: RNA-binding protein [Spirochaetaceae bacterium]|nr:RNA-binding protein [Spirochaetaceae bacterium]|tara:strand:- start:34460 stop:35149 length:690 start_codon:yes stop_codon:yes gene_type:complete